MALTLRGNGQVTSDNYTIDSDGDVVVLEAGSEVKEEVGWEAKAMAAASEEVE